MNRWAIWMNIIEGLSMLLSPVVSLFLFFAKTLRFQRVVLRVVASLLIINFVTLFFGEMGLWVKYFEASRFVRALGWFFLGMKPMWIFYAVVVAICSAGYFVSKRRISRKEKPHHPQPLPGFFQEIFLRETVPVFGIGKICSVVCVSLLAIGMLAFAREVIIERYFLGPPADLPGADYGKCVCYNHEGLMITVDKDGGISNRDRILSLPEFKAFLEERLADKPRSSRTYVDLEGRFSVEEYVEEISIHLRVDQQCSYKNLRRVLNALNEQKIRWGYFRVVEPDD